MNSFVELDAGVSVHFCVTLYIVIMLS